LLNTKNEELGKMCGVLEFENEEFDVKYEAFNNEIVQLEGKLEESFGESRELQKNL
jgi:hypothetical protein